LESGQWVVVMLWLFVDYSVVEDGATEGNCAGRVVIQWSFSCWRWRAGRDLR